MQTEKFEYLVKANLKSKPNFQFKIWWNTEAWKNFFQNVSLQKIA